MAGKIRLLTIFTLLLSSIWVKIKSQNSDYKESLSKEVDFLKKKKVEVPVSFQKFQLYIGRKDYPNALAVAVQLSEQARTADSIALLAKGYALQGEAYYFMKKYHESIEVVTHSLHLYQTLKDTLNIVPSLIRLSILHQHIGENEKALVFSSLAASYPVNENLEMSLYESFSTAYSNLRKNDSALNYIQKTLSLDKAKGDTANIVLDYMNIAVIYLRIKKPQTAIVYLDSTSLYNWESVTNGQIGNIYKAYYEAYMMLGQYERASYFIELYHSFKEQAYQNKIDSEIESLKQLYSDKAKLLERQQQSELEELSLERTNLFLIILLLVMSLIILTGIYVYITSRRKLANDKLKVEQRLLNVQMNPHFIFNTLAVIQAFIEGEHAQDASKYLNKFARLMRLNLENSREDFISLAVELKTLKAYLDLQLMRFAGEFDYRLKNEVKDGEELYIPPMIIQPFVENAIQHGIRNLGRKGIVSIELSQEGKVLRCVINDNGRGLASTKMKKDKKSLATEIVRERLQILSRELKQEAYLEINDKTASGGYGVEVVLIIPYIVKT